jgi:hypothetical protein
MYEKTKISLLPATGDCKEENMNPETLHQIEVLRECARRLKLEAEHLSWHGAEFKGGSRDLGEIRQHLIGIANDLEGSGGK